MTLQIVNEDNYVPAMYYAADSHTFTEKSVGTRYMVMGIRALVDPSDPEDIEQVHALQNEIRVSQSNPGRLELPNWDPDRTIRPSNSTANRDSTHSGC